MTPFYTPPLTPNPTPGMGTVGPNHQARPLSLSSAASHHPSAAAAAAAAAAAYYQSGPLSQPPSQAQSAVAAAAAAAQLAPSYYMASPQHHSIHPTPAPGWSVFTLFYRSTREDNVSISFLKSDCASLLSFFLCCLSRYKKRYRQP